MGLCRGAIRQALKIPGWVKKDQPGFGHAFTAQSMLVQILLAIALGTSVGIVTGLLPGIHINLVCSVVLASFINSLFSPLVLAVLLLSMATSNLLSCFICSTFLGVPSEEQALSVLPAQRLALQGRGMLALKLYVFGCFLGIMLCWLMAPAIIPLLTWAYRIMKPYTAHALIGLAVFTVWRERDANLRFWCLIVFLISGVLGLVLLNSSMNEPLLVMLSGLFGVSNLLLAGSRSARLAEQQECRAEVRPAHLLPALACGSMVSVMPTLGAGQASIIASHLALLRGEKDYLFTNGAITGVSFVTSILTAYAFGKARNGSTAMALGLIEQLDTRLLAMFAAATLIAACIATPLVLRLGGIIAGMVSRINYRIFSYIITAFVCLVVLLLCGPLGIIGLVAAVSIGIVAITSRISRTAAMGCLIVPVIMYYLV
ncbi:hypothetical protein COV22_01480 [Candidatus Woesearchaeota archaeon CG10_big_fil_rev_8_21_14_0_10_47_5]|nr:MAG: hypothetical protein AUJ69_02940 [Candidatus Woesearchaeota archaeon CG1_02_47_18]PIN73155.1 MAG: hypothetical protein COV22_01480 [Candidatus Woesearchaeota archaeon CG10_big_fil_rev_8_21_14_0_10_47_5]